MIKDETARTPFRASPAPPSRPRPDCKLIAVGPEEAAALDRVRLKFGLTYSQAVSLLLWSQSEEALGVNFVGFAKKVLGLRLEGLK